MTFLYEMSEGIMTLTLPLFSKSLGASDAFVGLIVAAGPLLGAFSAVPMGMLSDRYGRRALLVYAPILGVLSSILIAFTSQAPLLVPLYALYGLSHSSFRPTAAALVGEASRPERMATYFGWFLTIGSSGLLIGPPVAGYLILNFGHAYAAAFSGILVGSSFILGMLHPKQPKSSLPKRKAQMKIPFLRAGRALWGDWLFVFTADLLIGVVYAFLPLQLSRAGLNPVEIGLLFSVLQTASGLARLPMGILIDRIRKTGAALMGSLLINAVCIIAIAFSTSYALLSVLMLGTGLSRGVLLTAARTDIAFRAPPGGLGSAMGTFSVMSMSGRSAGPLIFGATVAVYGIGQALIYAGGVGVAVAVGVKAALRERRR